MTQSAARPWHSPSEPATSAGAQRVVQETEMTQAALLLMSRFSKVTKDPWQNSEQNKVQSSPDLPRVAFLEISVDLKTVQNKWHLRASWAQIYRQTFYNMHVRGAFRSHRGKELTLTSGVQTSGPAHECPYLPPSPCDTRSCSHKFPKYAQSLAWGWEGEAEVRDSGATVLRARVQEKKEFTHRNSLGEFLGDVKGDI